jgi:hypothetical protein
MYLRSVVDTYECLQTVISLVFLSFGIAGFYQLYI